ncbi:hypothetical protein [Streptomyces sp. NPDC089915]|uniref:hypothetical protein n=1 Tax=Streptomyces sp. NPDC089915 TaxID=3155186 RepID=UPI00341EF678
MSDSPLPAGPIFGPDSLVIDVNDLSVPIWPDALNTDLAAAGAPTRYYFRLPRLTVASQPGTADLEFSATVMVQGPVGPQPVYLGGSCTFSCTAALPAGTEAQIVDRLMSQDHPDPPARIAPLFAHQPGDPPPELSMVPITGSAVSCVIEHPPTGTSPLFMTVQGGPGGGIDPHTRSSFLVSFSPAAAEAVVTSLRDASAPPFLVRNVLTEQFATGPTGLTMHVDVDLKRTLESFVAAVPPGAAWPAGDAAEAAYESAVITGAIGVRCTETGTKALLDPSLAAWISGLDDPRELVFRLLKDPFFDIAAVPATETGQEAGPPAPAWWTAVFGDARVTLKEDPDTGQFVVSQTETVQGTVNVEHTLEARLTEVAEAARTELDKYLKVMAV